jgi:hypothetical protein
MYLETSSRYASEDELPYTFGRGVGHELRCWHTPSDAVSNEFMNYGQAIQAAWDIVGLYSQVAQTAESSGASACVLPPMLSRAAWLRRGERSS